MADPSPKDRFTSLDLWAVVLELRRLVGGRVDKVFDLEPAGISVSFRAREPGRRELWIVPGRYAAVMPPAREHAEELSPLSRALRRHLSGATLESVGDPLGERYLELRLRRPGEPEPLILAGELFGSGNLIVAREGVIAAVAQTRRWAHRDVRVGAPYVRPPVRTDPWKLGVAEIEAELARSRTDLASTLAARLGLGGPVAEEVVARLGSEPGAPAAPSAHEIAPRVHTILAGLVHEIGEAPRGYLVRREGSVTDASPYRSQRWEGVPSAEVVETPSFSSAAVEFFATLLRPAVPPEELARRAERRGLERLLERQRSAVEELEATVAARKADAEAVYAHYAEAERALEQAKVDPERRRAVEATLGDRTVALATGTDARGAAQALYEEAKRLAAKLDGAREALAATAARLEQETPSRTTTAVAPTVARPSAPRWFEKFRWFVSSEGALVVGGRDAGSNDLVVRRHLNEGDLYLHADLHGAASVVVKRPTPPATATEVTIREAAQWAVAFSKAWRAGLASATAFWASPDQVSKRPESGEFVARGAWMVRGTKHFVRDVPLELALGTIRYENDDLWTAAPPAAVRARGTVRYLLTPGEERDRVALEVELARALGIPRSRLQALLPAGGISARRA